MLVGETGDGVPGQPHQVLAQRRVHGSGALFGLVGERQRSCPRLPVPGTLAGSGSQLDGPPGGNLFHQVPGERGQGLFSVHAHPPSPLPFVFWPTTLPP
jgi:hypothetical protein